MLCSDGSKTFLCVQASALLLFNASDRLSYSEIMSQLNLTDEDVVRLLHSLSCSKYKILNKEPNNKTISPTDTFEFNSEFTDKMKRVKVGTCLLPAASPLPSWVLIWAILIGVEASPADSSAPRG